MNAISAVKQGDSWPQRRLADWRRQALTRLAKLWPCVTAVAGVFACTWLSFHFGQGLGSAGFLYLVFVVLAAVYGGFWQATFVSAVAVTCLDFFFDEPIFSFTVARPSSWVELAVFEFTALIISQLSNRAHLRELEANAERRDTARLYQVARQILLFDSTGDPGELVASLIREAFDLRQVLLLDGLTGTEYWNGDPMPETRRQVFIRETRGAYLRDSDQFESGTWFCVLRLGARPVGGLALCGTGTSRLIATALASLAAIALERARALEKQCQVEAERQAEQLRTAVLDALAHKFKTPLTVIRTASSGLPAAGDLSELQRELVSLIDQEARTLNDLASRLVGAPKLDTKEFEPEPEPLLFSRLIKASIQDLAQHADRDRFRVLAPPFEPLVFADRELILTALAQLVDNALKYSVPGSSIDSSIGVQGTAVVLKIRTRGLVVPAADRERIFERFYRAPGADKCSPGTGLGLSIVKTIAADHHGHVWAEGEPDYGSVFLFSLPVLPDGVTRDP